MKTQAKKAKLSGISRIKYICLLLRGVNCSDCNKPLSRYEILTHRYIGIRLAEEMSCTSCWMTAQ